MRKIFGVLVLFAVFISSCGSSEEREKPSETAVSAQKGNDVKMSFVKDLTYKAFIKEVWDFESYPDTVNFKGEQPCVKRNDYVRRLRQLILKKFYLF